MDLCECDRVEINADLNSHVNMQIKLNLPGMKGHENIKPLNEIS